MIRPSDIARDEIAARYVLQERNITPHANTFIEHLALYNNIAHSVSAYQIKLHWWFFSLVHGLSASK